MEKSAFFNYNIFFWVWDKVWVLINTMILLLYLLNSYDYGRCNNLGHKLQPLIIIVL